MQAHSLDKRSFGARPLALVSLPDGRLSGVVQVRIPIAAP